DTRYSRLSRCSYSAPEIRPQRRLGMAKIKLTKTAVDAANPKDRDYELRDTTIPGFLVKVTPVGRKIFMIAYVTNSGQRRKPAIGRYGEITVERSEEHTSELQSRENLVCR